MFPQEQFLNAVECYPVIHRPLVKPFFCLPIGVYRGIPTEYNTQSRSLCEVYMYSRCLYSRYSIPPSSTELREQRSFYRKLTTDSEAYQIALYEYSTPTCQPPVVKCIISSRILCDKNTVNPMEYIHTRPDRERKGEREGKRKKSKKDNGGKGREREGARRRTG